MKNKIKVHFSDGSIINHISQKTIPEIRKEFEIGSLKNIGIGYNDYQKVESLTIQ